MLTLVYCVMCVVHMYIYFIRLVGHVNRLYLVFFFKQKTAYEMRISDWSSDVCSSDLLHHALPGGQRKKLLGHFRTRQGPKPRARSAGQYHRHDHWVLRHGSRHLRSSCRSEERRVGKE